MKTQTRTFSILAVVLMSLTPSNSFAATPESSGAARSSSQDDIGNVSNNVNDDKDSLLQLPPSDPNNSDNIQTLQFGQAMKLDHLGPIILNTDGSTRRIDNWDILTEREKEVTWRRIKKRNAERRKILEAAELEKANAEDADSKSD